jgi:hypothetical protein
MKNKRHSNWSTVEPSHTEMHLSYRDAFAVNCLELELMCILFKKTQLNYVDYMCSGIRNCRFYRRQGCGDVILKGVNPFSLEVNRFPSLIFVYCR